MSTNFLPEDLGLSEHREGELAVRISGPERAVLELLQTLGPSASEYDHANLIFEGLGTLRAELVQSLLEQCASVKGKRLFLHLAEKHNHAWFKTLGLARVTLGTGKRMLFPGGRLDPKYLITVPVAAEPPSDAP